MSVRPAARGLLPGNDRDVAVAVEHRVLDALQPDERARSIEIAECKAVPPAQERLARRD